jgi:hypothetical protein
MRKLISVVAVAAAWTGAVSLTGPVAHADSKVPCTSYGVTAADNRVAVSLQGRLTGKLRNGVSGYQISCAREVVKTVKSRGLGDRAATIALATTIVETSIENLDYGDRDSEGLFQQRPSMGWGTPEQIRNPVYATNKFLDYMVTNVANWQTRPVGDVCQAVQRSGFPERYQPEAADAEVIAKAVMAMGARFSSDFDANGMTDFVTYTESDGNWHILYNNGRVWERNWGGQPGDRPVAGDFNANGLSDFTIYRPSTGTWHILYDDGSTYSRPWGGPGHIPVAGDFDANGMSDFVTYTPSDGYFHILYNNGTEYHRKWGGPGHVPVSGDFDGNGMTDFATYTPSDGYWHILYNDGHEYHRPWGQPGDVPVAGDYNANGMADFTVYRPSTSEWLILYNDGSTYTRQWGGPGHSTPA